MKIYLVGGAVRDEIMGEPVNDKDYVVVGSTREQMKSFGFSEVGKDFAVFLHPETQDEYALARSKNGAYSEQTTLEEDLQRRDLTMNSIAKDKDGNYFDPFNGIKDIENKVIRHTSDSFFEDPVRALRAARFLCRYDGFEITDETKEAMKRIFQSQALLNTSKERIWTEMEKTLSTPQPYRFFEILNEVNGLKDLFPEIENMKNVPQRPDYHAEGDVFIHNQLVLKEACEITKDFSKEDASLTRFACICHDFGKTKTPEKFLYNEDGSVKGSHYGHDKKGLVKPLINDFCERINAPEKYKKIATDVAFTHQKIHQIQSLSASRITRLLDDLSPGRNTPNGDAQRYMTLISKACEADARGRKICFNNQLQDTQEKINNHYPQGELLKDAYTQYSNTKEPLQNWMERYQERNEEKPRPDIIKERIHQIRVSNIKRNI